MFAEKLLCFIYVIVINNQVFSLYSLTMMKVDLRRPTKSCIHARSMLTGCRENLTSFITILKYQEPNPKRC